MKTYLTHCPKVLGSVRLAILHLYLGVTRHRNLNVQKLHAAEVVAGGLSGRCRTLLKRRLVNEVVRSLLLCVPCPKILDPVIADGHFVGAGKRNAAIYKLSFV